MNAPARAEAAHAAADLARRLFVLFKAASVYRRDNAGYRVHAAEACEALTRALEAEPELRFEAHDEVLFMNERPLDMRGGNSASGRFLTLELARRGVGALVFTRGAGARELDALAYAFAGVSRDAGLAELQEELRKAKVTAVVLRAAEAPRYGAGAGDGAAGGAGAGPGEGAGEGAGSGGGGQASGERTEVRDREPPAPAPEPKAAASGAEQARRTFFRAVDSVERMMTGLREGAEPDLEEAKTAVTDIARQVVADEQALFELSILRDFDEYTYAHCVNVCVYGVAIGVRLGLEGAALAELGFACLFHDAGKARLPRALIDKPDAFTDEEWALMRRHPALGARELLRLRRPLDGGLARAAVVAFEHHRGMDGSGYPRLPGPRRQDVYSRICAIADAFDALTSGRVYVKRALAPDEAVLRMAQRASAVFDLLLFRLFVGAVGAFPIGTLLRLDTGERAVVRRNTPGDLLRPQLVLVGPDGAPAGPADLAETVAPGARPARSIARPLDPRREKVDPAAVLGVPRGG